MDRRSYYEVLEVDEAATDDEIKRAYRRLAMKYHPDKNSEGTEQFKEISHAYETLNDPEKRAVYDQYGADGPSGPEMYGDGSDINDIYAEMFGGGMFCADKFGSGGPRTEKHPLSVSLEDMFRGKKMRMKLERSVPCRHCKGLGSSRTEEQIEAVVIKIDPGMADGQKIVLKGKGDQNPDAKEPLDLVFELQQTPHKTFTRSGDHLIVNAEIDLAEAICGFSRVLVTHLDGRPLMVSHKGAVLQPGEVLCISNEGMPREQSPRVRGDLFIKVSIKFPEKGWTPDPELRKLLPSTRWPKDAQAPSDDADVEVSVGHPLSAQAFKSRTRQNEPSRRQHYYDDDEYDSDYTDVHGDAVPECQTQ
ncbi:DnaJ-like protein xdj1 [Coemansia sp. IMI 209127]|nr:DnaJ-like protein xdj1 [Coemansia sp. IMI 209127]